MLRPGLVSISFRSLSPREIVDLCVQSALEGIEWGGDVHVPHGEIQIAREVGQMTRDEGLEVAAYGSYYRCNGEIPFEKVLESAVELGAPLIRVWAGNKGSADTTPSEKAAICADIRAICDLAGAQNIGIATEYHGGTLSDTRESCRAMLNSVAHPNFKTLWQPLRRGGGMNLKISENLEDLRDVAPDLSNIHVYEWRDIVAGQRKAFSLRNSPQWPQYIEELRKIGGHRWMLLEYVPDDDPQILARESAALSSLLEI